MSRDRGDDNVPGRSLFEQLAGIDEHVRNREEAGVSDERDPYAQPEASDHETIHGDLDGDWPQLPQQSGDSLGWRPLPWEGSDAQDHGTVRETPAPLPGDDVGELHSTQVLDSDEFGRPLMFTEESSGGRYGDQPFGEGGSEPSPGPEPWPPPGPAIPEPGEPEPRPPGPGTPEPGEPEPHPPGPGTPEPGEPEPHPPGPSEPPIPPEPGPEPEPPGPPVPPGPPNPPRPPDPIMHVEHEVPPPWEFELVGAPAQPPQAGLDHGWQRGDVAAAPQWPQPQANHEPWPAPPPVQADGDQQRWPAPPLAEPAPFDDRGEQVPPGWLQGPAGSEAPMTAEEAAGTSTGPLGSLPDPQRWANPFATQVEHLPPTQSPFEQSWSPDQPPGAGFSAETGQPPGPGPGQAQPAWPAQSPTGIGDPWQQPAASPVGQATWQPETRIGDAPGTPGWPAAPEQPAAHHYDLAQFQQAPPQQPQAGPPQPQVPQAYQAQPQGPPVEAVPWQLPPQQPIPLTSDNLAPQTLLRPRKAPPTGGWRRAVFKVSGGYIDPGESSKEVERQQMIAQCRTPVAGGHYRVAVLSLKGGVGKTTTTVGLGSTLATLRGDRVIAVDANPDRGTLSEKVRLETRSNVRDLLAARDRISRYADVRQYTSQAASRLEVLASDPDPAVSEAFSESDYRAITEVLEHFYSICITDCGTGLLHSAMRGVLGLADQIVLVSSASVDGARSASATLDWLDAHNYGMLVRSGVVVMSAVRPQNKAVDLSRLEQHFSARCRTLVRIPFDPHLEAGAEFMLEHLDSPTRDAYLQLTASVAAGFQHRVTH